MDVDVVEDAAGRGGGETRRSCCLHGGRHPRRDAGSSGGAPAARARRRRRTPSFILRRRSWCVAPVAAVPAGEGWARTARGPVGRDWALERCTAPVRALWGPVVVPLLHGVVDVASRGRRLGPWLVPLEVMAIGLFGPESIREWRSFEFSGRYDIPKDRNSPCLGSQNRGVATGWVRRSGPRRCCGRRPQRRRCRVFAGRGVRFLAS